MSHVFSKFPFIFATLISAMLVTDCVSVHDPLIGKVNPALKGCEFGPSNELLADLKAAEKLVVSNDDILAKLEKNKFFVSPETDVLKDLTAEFGGNANQANATYLHYAKLPLFQSKLKSQLYDLVDRLLNMEAVRKQTDYVRLVKTQGEQNERMRKAQLENSNSLKSDLANNANFYNSLGNGPDVIQHKDSRGSYYDETTFKGMNRQSTLANQKLLEDKLKMSEASNAQERQNAANEQASFLERNPGLAETRAYISGQSDLISEKLWPALKASISEFNQSLATANTSSSKTK